MARIPDHIIEQVREAHDIVEIVRRAVPLKQAGAGFKGLCPFHDEKTPSFTVHPGRQTYKCFGCGKGGNVFGFLMETAGLNFPEAVRQLAEERGIEVPRDRAPDPEADERFERIRQALSAAHRVFVRALASDAGREARDYLERRGYDAEARKRFGLGYAPPSWDHLIGEAAKAGVSVEALEHAGLVVPRRERDGHYDRFRHRVMFPIADARGRLATFAGRTLDPDDPAKYMNGPETDVFKKTNVLYALHRARDAVRRSGEALLMEGYTDVLMCHMHGFENAVAGMGTAFTQPQARQLARIAERVILLYDADDAGRLAAERALEVLLQEGLEVRVALLPEGRDVDEILLEEGPEALHAVLAESRDLFEFKLGVLAGRHDLGTPRGRAKASEELVASITNVKSAIERDQLLRMVAERLGGGPDTEAVLRQEMARRLGEVRSRRGRPGAATPPPPVVPDEPPRLGEPEAAPAPRADDPFARVAASAQERDEHDLLGAALALPALRDAIFRAVGPEEFTAAARQRLYNALLSLWEQGGEIHPQAVLAHFQADSEVTAVIAGLPEDPTLEERVTSWIAFTEQHRLQTHHQREIARLARGAGAAIEGATEELDPDGSWYGDVVSSGPALDSRRDAEDGGPHDGVGGPEA
ncbi:MAG: DNA primase [Planctomycetota bacterium]|nr:DNA primase [Planctomycetota bacterium]